MTAQPRHRRQFLLTALAFFALPAAGSAQDELAALREALAVHVDEAIEPTGFTGALLVSLGDEVLLRRGLGMADHEAGVANTPETRFRIASISKQFTAATILRLADQDLLELDALAGEYWEDTPASWSEVTLRHLLTHTSGIYNFTKLLAYRSVQSKPLRPADVLAMVAGMPLDFAPGTNWSYSNSAYVMLALVAERVGEARFEDVLQREVLRPLGMHDSGSESAVETVPGLARGYARGAPDWEPAEFIDMNVPTGGGGMFSTVDDLRTWARALSARSELFEPATWETMLTPVRNNYGLGVLVEDFEGGRRISHSGGIEGFSTWLGIYPERDAVIVILANSEDVDAGAHVPGLEALLTGAAAVR